jgi:hypothetical protein
MNNEQALIGAEIEAYKEVYGNLTAIHFSGAGLREPHADNRVVRP